MTEITWAPVLPGWHRNWATHTNTARLLLFSYGRWYKTDSINHTAVWGSQEQDPQSAPSSVHRVPGECEMALTGMEQQVLEITAVLLYLLSFWLQPVMGPRQTSCLGLQLLCLGHCGSSICCTVSSEMPLTGLGMMLLWCYAENPSVRFNIYSHSVCVESLRKDRPGKMAFYLNIVRIRYLGMHLLPCTCPNKLPPSFIQSAELSVPLVQHCWEQGAGHCLCSPQAGTVFCSGTPWAWVSAWQFLNQGVHHWSCLKTYLLILFVLSTNEQIHWNRHPMSWSKISVLRGTEMINIFVTYISLSIFIQPDSLGSCGWNYRGEKESSSFYWTPREPARVHLYQREVQDEAKQWMQVRGAESV